MTGEVIEMLNSIIGVREIRSCENDSMCYYCQESLDGKAGIHIHVFSDNEEGEVVSLACEECADDFVDLICKLALATLGHMMIPAEDADEEPEPEPEPEPEEAPDEETEGEPAETEGISDEGENAKVISILKGEPEDAPEEAKEEEPEKDGLDEVLKQG